MNTLGPPQSSHVRPAAAGRRPHVGGKGSGGPAVRIPALGAVSGLVACCFLAMLLADSTGWSAVGDVAFIAGCGATACLTKRGSLLAVSVTPPMIYFLAVLAASLVSASGTFSVLSGLFITLGTSAPWLFLGTGLSLGVATFRGLPEEVADFVADLRGLPLLAGWPELARRREGHPLLDRLDLGDVAVTVIGEHTEHVGHQVLGDGSTTGHADRAHTV